METTANHWLDQLIGIGKQAANAAVNVALNPNGPTGPTKTQVDRSNNEQIKSPPGKTAAAWLETNWKTLALVIGGIVAAVFVFKKLR